jgi:hypothetical protein
MRQILLILFIFVLFAACKKEQYEIQEVNTNISLDSDKKLNEAFNKIKSIYPAATTLNNIATSTETSNPNFQTVNLNWHLINPHKITRIVSENNKVTYSILILDQMKPGVFYNLVMEEGKKGFESYIYQYRTKIYILIRKSY